MDEVLLGKAAMVGFRNVAVHNDQELDLDAVRSILETQLDDLKAFAAQAFAAQLIKVDTNG